ncbi:MAG: DUF4864 domain-containing protein [Candidatus Gracilibacteria bacterium]
MKIIFKVLIGIVVVIALLIGIGLWATSGIAGIAEKQIALIAEGKVEEAYNTYSSKDFKAVTTLEQFKVFVLSQKALSENVKASFFSREVSTEGIGTLEAKLEGKDGSTTNLKYTLVKEGEDWKILNMEFPQAGLMDKEENATTSSVIREIAMADTADEDDVVASGVMMTTFKPDTAVIYVSVYLTNPATNMAVSGLLQYPETGDELGPVSFVTKEGGDQTVMFTFSKPTAGWMVGDYIFKLNVGTSEEKIVNFKVE